jgi:hypothetical protein
MKILLYAPILTGHPQVYCRVIGEILLEAGCDVCIAAATDPDTVWDDWNDLRVFAGRKEVSFVDTRTMSEEGTEHLRAEEMVALQKTCSIDSTLFVEGDWFREQFIRIGSGEAPRLHGRNVAICAGVCHWYPGEDGYTGKRQPLFGPTLRQTLGRFKRAVLNQKESDRYFYKTVLAKRRVVDSIIVKDERITERYGAPFFWMPEIYRVFDGESDAVQGADFKQFSAPVEQYIEQAGAANVLLYFGTGTWYKGYDYFLKLAESDPSTFALHAGAPERSEPKTMAFDTDGLKSTLREQGRLFETNGFVESSALVDLLFNSIERFVSTHRLTLSSGTMLQALEAGKPVLVPGTGLVGWRVERFGLGKTYRYQDEQDLVRNWRAFRKEPVDEYGPRINEFMQQFSRENVALFFTEQLCG